VWALQQSSGTLAWAGFFGADSPFDRKRGRAPLQVFAPLKLLPFFIGFTGAAGFSFTRGAGKFLHFVWALQQSSGTLAWAGGGL